MVEHSSRGDRRLLKPIIVGWLVTTKCQLRCHHCWFDHTQPHACYDERLTIAHRLARAGFCRICLSGGEVTLVSGLNEILRVLKKDGTPVAIYTNAIEPFQKNGASWLECWDHEIDYVQVSLDGGDRTDFDNQRGRGSFRRFLRGVRLLRHNKIRMLAHFIATPYNRAKVHQAARLALDLGFEGFVAQMFQARGNAANIKPDQTLQTARSFNNSVAGLLQDDELLNSSLKLGIAFPISLPLPDYVNYRPAKHSLRIPLKSGNAHAFISPTGSVLPAAHLHPDSKYGCGSLLTDEFTDIWKYGTGFKQMPKYRDLSQALCARCPSVAICRGGNWQRAYDAFGSYDAHNPECHFSRETGSMGFG